MNTFRKLWMIVALLPLAVGCGGEASEPDRPATAASDTAHAEGDEHAEGEAGHEEGGAEVTLTAEQLRASGVVVDTARTTALADGFTAPARVVPGPQGEARVGTLVPGRVTRLIATEGQTVGRGAALAEVESFDVVELGADLTTARARAEQAAAALRRAEALAAENLTPARNVEEARAAYRTAQAEQAAATAKLRTLGVAGGAPSGRFVVRAPIGGTVTAREVTLGEYVDPSRDLYEITAAGSSFVEAQVPTGQAGGLRAGTTVEVTAGTGDGAVRYRGRVVSVAPLVEAASRTVPVRVALAAGSLRAGTFVTARFEVGAGAEAVAVPAEAVERAPDGTFVYVAVEGEPGTFARTEVELGEETGSGVVVRAGLEPGQPVVTRGVFYLRSARQRGELAEHDH